MPSLTDHQSQTANKLLLLGNSGSGKTGMLGSLANAGYRLFILDYDNGLDVLMDPMIVKPEFRKNIFFKTLTDKIVAGVPQMPSACRDGLNALTSWMEPDPANPGKMISLGGAYDWGGNDVIVIDSATFFGNAAMRQVLTMAGRPKGPAQVQDWGEAIRIQETLLEQLYSDSVKCNVIFTAHLSFQDDGTGGGIPKGYPSFLGTKLPPKVGRYFNSVLMVEKQVMGQTITRKLRTVANYNVELKNPKPSKIPAEMEPDLAKYFKLIKEA